MAKMNEVIEFLGFAPEAPVDTPGALLICQNFIPTSKGSLRSPFGAVDRNILSIGVPSAATVRGISAPAFAPDGYFMDAGTDTNIWRMQRNGGLTWSPVGRSAGSGTYVVTSGGYWLFEQFGKSMVAARGDQAGGVCPLQAASYTIAGVYADISGAPLASVLAVTDRFVLAFCEPGDDNVDRWRCSARDDHTNWSLSPATLCATGRLVDTPGPIIGAKNFGNDVIVYKANSMFRGRFVEGLAEVWGWELLPYRSGTSNPRTVVNVGTKQYSLSNTGLYEYDGAQLTELMGPYLRPWYERFFGVQNYPQSALVHDAGSDNLVCYIGTYLSMDQFLWYNLKSQKWGLSTKPPVATNILPHSRYSSPTGTGSLRLAMFNTAGHQWVYDQEQGTAVSVWQDIQYILTAYMGVDDVDTELTKVRVHGAIRVNTPQMSTITRKYLDDFDNTGLATTSMQADGHFDVREIARYHQFRILYGTGNANYAEIYGLSHDLERADDGR